VAYREDFLANTLIPLLRYLPANRHPLIGILNLHCTQVRKVIPKSASDFPFPVPGEVFAKFRQVVDRSGRDYAQLKKQIRMALLRSIIRVKLAPLLTMAGSSQTTGMSNYCLNLRMVAAGMQQLVPAVIGKYDQMNATRKRAAIVNGKKTYAHVTGLQIQMTDVRSDWKPRTTIQHCSVYTEELEEELRQRQLKLAPSVLLEYSGMSPDMLQKLLRKRPVEWAALENSKRDRLKFEDLYDVPKY